MAKSVGREERKRLKRKNNSLPDLLKLERHSGPKRKKGDITAEFGKHLVRTQRGRTTHNFPQIQVGHGQFKQVENLCYKNCTTIGEIEEVDTNTGL